jgi:hypothetical protein
MVGSQVRCSCGACQRVRCLVAVILAAVPRLPRRCAAVTLGAEPRYHRRAAAVTLGAVPRYLRRPAAVTLGAPYPPARCRAPSAPYRVTSGALPRPPSARCAALPPADCRGHPRRAVPRYLRRPAAVTLGAPCRVTSGALPRSPSAPCRVTSGALPRSSSAPAALPPSGCRVTRVAVPRCRAVTLGAVSRLLGRAPRRPLRLCRCNVGALRRTPKPHLSQARGLPTLGILGRAYR